MDRQDQKRPDRGHSAPGRGAPSTASRGETGSSRGGDSGGRGPLPQVSLPKGGGAIRGIGEKFTANPVTGTGSWQVPLPVSPGRSGFGPQLALSYDSGAGNGPFGFGWNLSLPAITRKTDKGLPQYLDHEESDVFILSGAEDLVPVLVDSPTGLVPDETTRAVDNVEYRVKRYRPRVEGLFARIERWMNPATGEAHWRSISKDNITTIYGDTSGSRIADPVHSTWRVFSWLISTSCDDKGNVVLYEYKGEDSAGVDLARAHEYNRSDDAHALGSRRVNRYLKRVRYGNRVSRLDATGYAVDPQWMFEVVFDYGDHDPDAPTPDETTAWGVRQDPFSSYRPTFEVRTYRLCRRVMMFHHIPSEGGVTGYDGIVRSVDLGYQEGPVASFLTSVVQNGYNVSGQTWTKRSMPALTFGYSQPVIDDTIRQLDAESLEGLPAGLGAGTQWVDLDGEGAPGVIIEQAGAWNYKRNVSANNQVTEGSVTRTAAKFEPLARVGLKPNALLGGGARFMDMAGDGSTDLAVLGRPMAGFWEREGDGWAPFRSFAHWPNVDPQDPNLRFVDLDGDGLADILITEHDALTWHPSEGEKGFGAARRARKPRDEEKGPAVVFADGTQSVYLADLSGDGLADLVRIRNGEVCYWPNLGYGRFGAKVTMDGSPRFDRPDQFNQRRIVLADIDGSGTTDIIYLGADGIRLYFNQSGNRFSAPRVITAFPPVDNVSSVSAMDLLGTGTACLVWSSPLPGYSRSPMRYIDLMSGAKPHLLTVSANGLGAETHVTYAPSTKFYQADRAAGKSWITKLPFPVQVVERVETLDRVSRNRFVTRYAYHHGHFDGVEREFRGFGMVEQWDTEQYAAFTQSDLMPDASNGAPESHVPPVLTRTWFHTGVFAESTRVSRHFEDEYYRPTGLTDQQFEALLLPDTVLPTGLKADEVREACRALKGSPLRKEVYAEDESAKVGMPYTASELNYTLNCLQPQAGNRHSVFFAHPREVIDYHYERNPFDPRVQHALTLDVDDYGNVLRSAAVGYGRLGQPGQNLPTEQTTPLVTLTVNSFTNPVTQDDDYRAPLPKESVACQLTGKSFTGNRYMIEDFGSLAGNNPIETDPSTTLIEYTATTSSGVEIRPLAHTRTVYQADNLSGSLAWGTIESRGLPYETYTKAFSPAHLTAVYGQGRVTDAMMEDGGYVHWDANDTEWWVPSGRVFFAPDGESDPEGYAETHFFLPCRFEDPFGNAATVEYDRYDLLVQETTDAAGNQATAGERPQNQDGTYGRQAGGPLDAYGNDYRVLAPVRVMDPNGNRVIVQFDALGRVAGTAVRGKPGAATGDMWGTDRWGSFNPDPLGDDEIDAFLFPATGEPVTVSDPVSVIGTIGSRFFYDPFAYQRTASDAQPRPAAAVTLVRENHYYPTETTNSPVRVTYACFDGFGREIQRKVEAEPDPNTPTVKRWVGSGWTIFNNKGKPVRQYEPFFSATFAFEFAMAVGVSPILFYDPLDRVVGTLHPDHSWEKVVFDAWEQVTWDRNDTVGIGDPAADADIGEFIARLPEADYAPTWHARFSDESATDAQKDAAAKALAHADTPTTVRFDVLGRPFLTVQHNGFDEATPPAPILYEARVALDIEGNELSVTDALSRVVMTYAYERRKTRARQDSVDAGARWTLPDVAGNPIRAWDERDHAWRKTYDVLRRPVETWLTTGTETAVLVEKIVYGESAGGPAVPETTNVRTKVIEVRDTAGIVASGPYDFKGNLLSSTRTLATDYAVLPDWNCAVDLEAESFTTSTTYDALNRVVTRTTPDGSVAHPTYNAAGLLESLSVNLRGATNATAFITNLDYDAHGRRILVQHGNGVDTAYAYDLKTFRLTSIVTTRTSDSRILQDLAYTYDPVGNVTRIADAVQKVTFYDNDEVSADRDYTYDPLYRLIGASGREHPGQLPPPGDAPWLVGIPHPEDSVALRSYAESYVYDAVGNFEQMIHSGGSQGSWTRDYAYVSGTNRLASTTVGNGTETYSHDAHGNMTAMPHLATMAWDAFDRLAETSPGSGQPVTYYVYDAQGQRVRKVTETGGESSYRSKERIYLGDYEVYREYNANGNIPLERETLHVMDDKQRVALVETRTVGDDGTPEQLVRCQHADHLTSACVETNGDGAIVTYEEYFPYGGTSFHSATSGPAAKRYRYTGKERDDENGFTYHGARYYAPWLGRWTAADPEGVFELFSSHDLAAETQPIDFTREDTHHRHDSYDQHSPSTTYATPFHSGEGILGYAYASSNPIRHIDLDGRLTYNADKGTFNIARGDTYWSISRDTGIPVRDIIAANPGMQPRRLQVGATVNLPQSAGIETVKESVKHLGTKDYAFITPEGDSKLLRYLPRNKCNLFVGNMVTEGMRRSGNIDYSFPSYERSGSDLSKAIRGFFFGPTGPVGAKTLAVKASLPGLALVAGRPLLGDVAAFERPGHAHGHALIYTGKLKIIKDGITYESGPKGEGYIEARPGDLRTPGGVVYIAAEELKKKGYLDPVYHRPEMPR